jgi:hypothetical protein
MDDSSVASPASTSSSSSSSTTLSSQVQVGGPVSSFSIEVSSVV